MKRLIAHTLLAAGLFLGCTSPAWSQVVLPEGNGKQLVQRACMRCHALERLAGPDGGIWPNFGPGKNREEWDRIVKLMMTYGTNLTKEEVPVVTDYLSRSFPGPPRPPGFSIAGPVQVSIKEWKLPTVGTRPHDPALAPDGSVWYTGQASSLVGRLDPTTGAFQEFRLTSRNQRLPYGVGPHGITADRQGNIWFTAQLDSYIGKLDPKTGEIKEYRMPDPNARDPHTPVFDHEGTLWFTLQNSNMVGRLVPSTGEITLITMPIPNSQPYGIAVNSRGIPFFTQLTGQSIGSIDPETLQVHEYPLKAGVGPRRIAITPDDVVWYTDYPRGKLGRLDPKTGKTTEWPSPGGVLAQGYGITNVGNILWYVEANSNPNVLVRFDPATEKFQDWPLPSGGGIVRHMVAAPDGSLWLAESETDMLAKVEIKP